MPEDDDWFDPDVSALSLSYGEKAGLQIYRNYTRSFEDHAVKQFTETLDREQLDVDPLRRLVTLVSSEDARFVPVIACAFADETLKEVFRLSLPEGVPGGRAGMLGGYGPLADLSKRIQMAHAFDVMSRDLMIELDHLRSARNAISHNWDVAPLSEFYKEGRIAQMFRVEDMLARRPELASEFATRLDDLMRFRVRVVWLLCRLVYEAKSYHRAKAARLTPHRALYGTPATKWLGTIAEIALDATRAIATGRPVNVEASLAMPPDA